MVRDTSLCGLGQSAPNPVLTTLRHFRHEFEDHIRAKRCRAGVCEDLALSPCENSCPLHMNIPRFLQLYKEGRLEDAFLSVILDNPLPASTGRVCQHPCDDRCRRAAHGRGGQHARRAPADRRLGAPLRQVRRDGRARSRERKLSRPGARSPSSGAGPDRPHLRLLPRAARPQRHRLRLAPGGGRHAALRAARVPAAQGGARQGDRAHRAPGRPSSSSTSTSGEDIDAQRPRPPVRRRLPRDRHLEGGLGLPARHRAHGRHPRPAVPRGRRRATSRSRSAGRWS